MMQRFLSSSSRRATFLRFACVGAVLAVVDIGGLYLLHAVLGINVYQARVVSLLATMVLSYCLNRQFTFRRQENSRPLLQEMGRFYAILLAGGLLNYAAFSAVIGFGQQGLSNPWMLTALPALAVWVGGSLAMCFNYICSEQLVFNR